MTGINQMLWLVFKMLNINKLKIDTIIWLGAPVFEVSKSESRFSTIFETLPQIDYLPN
jgi:hypothetical protein